MHMFHTCSQSSIHLWVCTLMSFGCLGSTNGDGFRNWLLKNPKSYRLTSKMSIQMSMQFKSPWNLTNEATRKKEGVAHQFHQQICLSYIWKCKSRESDKEQWSKESKFKDQQVLGTCPN